MKLRLTTFYKCAIIRRKMSSASEVLFERRGPAGVITLNRPKALNALNLNMANLIRPQLEKWQTDVKFVIIKGHGEKAFCAGGDVRAAVEMGKANDPNATEFFRSEYRLNYLIGTLKVPYIALIHGITMGGGVGLSVHGKYRVATEKTVFAMPETAIGLFPDVGGSYFLSRLPNNLGKYYGLSGYRLIGQDVLFGGIATHYCDYNKLAKLEEELVSTSNADQIEKILDSYTDASLQNNRKDFTLEPHIVQIRDHFSANTIEDLLRSLDSDDSKWAKEQKETILKMSPTSLKVTLRQLQLGAEMSFKECLEMEFRMVCRSLKDKDFYEGVRAVLLDKDNKPKWDPPTIKDVTDDIVQLYFSKVSPNHELVL